MNRRLILALVPLLCGSGFGAARAVDEPARAERSSLNDDRRPAPGWAESPGPARSVQQEAQQEIDQATVRQIRTKQRSGASLTEEETAYLQRAEESRRKRNEAFRKENRPRESTGLAPLIEMGTTTYHGFEGGLYPGAGNEPQPQHLQAGLELARQIVPRDREGRPVQDGKIVLISVGMSNTTQEFRAFQELAAGDSDINPRLVIVDGAQGSQAASVTADPQAKYWSVLEERLSQAGVSPEQVQTAWVKQAGPNPSRPFPAETKVLQGYLLSTVHNLKARFPNPQIAYLSSRIYAGFAETPLNPEPHAYESGFALKWLIADQMAGKPELNYDRNKGPVRSPWLAWGPYLWSDGTKGRRDGLIYTREDLASDGTHPSPAGRRKVAGQLLAFLKNAPTARSWFLQEPEKPTPDKANVSYDPHERNVLDFWQSRSGEPAPSISEEASPIEEIVVASRDGHNAQAVLRKPPGKGPFPALIYLHGGLETRPIARLKEDYLKGPTLSRFLDAGYVVASAVLRSQREDPQTPVVLWDCIAIIEHIRRMPEVDPKSVVVYGTSGGGSLALELAGEIELAAIAIEEPATVLFTGLFTRDVVKDRPLGETIMNEPKRFYTPEVQRHTRRKIQKIASPIFIAHGDRHAINRINNDVFIPELKAAGKTVEVVLYPGAPHGFSMGRRGPADAAKKFFADAHAFFTRHLATKPARWSARRERPGQQRAPEEPPHTGSAFA